MLPIEHFHRAARRWPDRTAVETADGTLSFAELHRRAMALAAAFQALDPAPQSRVGICGYNTPEHLLAWLATFAAGKTWVPLNPRNGREELDRIVGLTEPSIVVVDADCLDKVDPQAARLVVGRPGPGMPGEAPALGGLIEAHAGEAPVFHDLPPDATQAIKFTGGSSGRPKGCVQTYRVWNTCIASMLIEFGFDGADKNLLAAPMTHGTNTLIMPILSVGGTQAFMEPHPKPSAILDALERSRATTVFLPPTVIYMMMAETGIEGRDFSALRHLIVGGAAMRPDAVARAMPLFNEALETCFGQTEAPQIAICMRAEDWRDPRNHASTGRATVLTRVATMAPDGTLLPPGESGEIVLKGDLVMAGYFEMPEATAETIKDGWLHTGDVGLVDARGFVFIKDRIRDVIITGGFNVYPSDVEAVLGQHPAIKECVVFGIDDEKWGEAVNAAVELHAGAQAAADELIAFVKDRLDSVKAPKAVHVVAELPRSPVGKVLRREAKAMFQDRAA